MSARFFKNGVNKAVYTLCAFHRVAEERKGVKEEIFLAANFGNRLNGEHGIEKTFIATAHFGNGNVKPACNKIVDGGAVRPHLHVVHKIIDKL